jgi:hypothetical protein
MEDATSTPLTSMYIDVSPCTLTGAFDINLGAVPGMLYCEGSRKCSHDIPNKFYSLQPGFRYVSQALPRWPDPNAISEKHTIFCDGNDIYMHIGSRKEVDHRLVRRIDHILRAWSTR